MLSRNRAARWAVGSRPNPGPPANPTYSELIQKWECRECLKHTREGALILEAKNAQAQQKRDGATLTKTTEARDGYWSPRKLKIKG